MKKELISIFPQVVKPFKDLYHLISSSKPLEYEDIPNDSRLYFDKRYKILKSEISRHLGLIEEAARSIPLIEEKLVPTRHNLTILHMDEEELRPLDDKLDEIDLQEKIEKEIVERFMLDRKQKREVSVKERMRKVKEELEVRKIKEKYLQEQKDIELTMKRKQLMGILKVEIHNVYFISNLLIDG